MDFRQLEVFRAVMDCGSATGAARLLKMSQPAVSRHVSQIEAELGLELFLRGGGKLSPTAEAVALYDEATLAFESIERVLNLARRMREDDRGVLRLAVPFAFCEWLLPRVLAELQQQRPQLRYSVELGTYESIATMLARRQVDIGIVKAPWSTPGIATLPLAKCGTVCVLPKDHALARQPTVSIDSLSREPLVLLGRDTAWRSDLQTLLRTVSRTPVVRIDTHSLAAVCAFVAQGLGVSVLPALLAAQFTDKGLVLRPLQATIEHEYLIGCPASLQKSGIVKDFARSAGDVAQWLLAHERPADAVKGPRARPARTKR